MNSARFSRRIPAALAIALAIAATALPQAPARRPLTHNDYDQWRTINSQKLSPDGKFAAYALFPQEGDGEVVVLNIATGQERREPAGARPEAPPRDAEAGPPGEGGPPEPRGISLSFTSDSRYAVFTTLPPKADEDKAKRERRRPDDMPKGGLVIMDLNGGDPVRVARVRDFQAPENGAGWIAYHKEGAAEEPAAEDRGAESKRDQRRPGASGRGGRGRSQYGSELVLRNLSSGTDRAFADVLEYSLSKDAKTLVYTVASRKEDTNGVYAVTVGTEAAATLLSGKGKYTRLTWDEKQDKLAFLSDRDDAASKPSKQKLYLWTRSGAPEAVVSTETPGFRQGFVISDRGTLSFSKDGSRLFFGCAPPAAEAPSPESDGAAAPADDKAVVDLWHWKDDNVQPMQKVRAAQDRNRSYRAVYHIGEKRFVQLADPTMQDLSPLDNGRFALGGDDREYRQMVEYDERHSDHYLVDTMTGARTPLLKKHRGSLIPSPDGKWAVSFNGRDWESYSLADGRRTNLTSNLGVAFQNEEFDSPGTNTPYGLAGWTKDSKYALLYDRYDVWEVSPAGNSARNLTDGVGRREKLQFRYVRFGDEEGRGPGGGRGGFGAGGGDRAAIDPAEPILLRAESLETRETGFWRDRIESAQPPQKLAMSAKGFTTPAKAKNADVVMLTATRFDEFGDLLLTDSNFKSMRKISNANPQKAQFTWGAAELMSYKNTDGVPLSGLLYKPDNFDPKKQYPMIVYIYERLSQGLHRFITPAPGHSINITYYVSNGYLVLTPDIAYTIGYPGQSALKCVLPAIQAVVDKGFVKESAIGIQGHSWGGYQIAYMVTQTNRFRAAEAGAPVADMISAYDGIRWGSGLPRQFQYERTQSRIGGSLWQYPTRFIENSPIFSADRVQTPLLILHNDQDDAVPWYQGIEYHLALRRLGKESYLFNYNGEPHHLLRRANQKDYTMRMQQFFDHFLKDGPKPEWMQHGIPFLDREQEKERFKASPEIKTTGAP